MRILAAFLGSSIALCSTIGVCSGTALAQAKPSVLRYVPKEADLVIRMNGPARFARSFAGTNLGKALSDPQVAPYWGKLITHFQVSMELDADGPSEEDQVRMAEAYELLLGYEGEVLFAARGDWREINQTEELCGAAVFAWSNDETAAKVTALIAEVLPQAKGEVEVAGVAASLREGDGIQWLGPVEHEGHTVLMMGQKLQERAQWFFEDLPDPEDVARFGKHPFAMVMNLPRFSAFAVEALAVRGSLPIWLCASLGTESVEEVGFYMFADGKFVAQEIEMRFNGEPRGLIGVMCPPNRPRPSLLDYRPPDSENYAAGPFDVDHLQKVYETVFAKYGDYIDVDRAQVEQMFTQMTKLDLVKDVLAHIGNEYMRIDDVSAEGDWDEDEPEAVQKAKEKYGESCYVVKLANGKAFAKSLDTAIRARGLHVGRKREAYGDLKIYRMNLLGMIPIEYAVTDTMLVLGVGGGEGTKRNLRAVLDNVAAVAAGDGPEFGPGIAKRIAQLPAGWGGIQVGSLIEILDIIVGAGEGLQVLLEEEDLTLDDVDDPWQLILDGSRALKKVMNRHDAGLIVNVDYYQKDRYVMRSRW